MIGLRAQVGGVILPALIVIILVAGICSGQVLGIRTFDDRVIPDQNVLLVQEMRNSASPDAVGPVASHWKIAHSGGMDQPAGILLWQWLGIDDTECVSAIADMNDDGYPDVLTENFDSGASGNNFSCLSGHNEAVRAAAGGMAISA
jgi:hypothetical protein